VAFILFLVELVVVILMSRPNPPAWSYGTALMVAGFACVALGWLALTTGD
jgi:hypothetical protein